MITALIGALISNGVQYLKEKQAYEVYLVQKTLNDSSDSSKVQVEERYRSKVSTDRQNEVDLAAIDYRNLQQSIAYMANTPFTGIDVSALNTQRQNWMLTMETTPNSVVGESYSATLLSDGAISFIKERLGLNISVEYISDILSVVATDVGSGISLTISMVIPEGYDPVAVGEALKSCIMEYVPAVIELDDVEVSMVSEETIIDYSSILKTRMAERQASIDSARASLNSKMTTFTTDELNLYRLLTGDLTEATPIDAGKSGSDLIAYKVRETPPTLFSFRQFVLGAIIGSGAYAAVIFFSLMFGRHLSSADELVGMYRVYLIDEEHKKIYNNWIMRFLIDEKIYRKRFKKANFRHEEGITHVQQQIAGLIDGTEIKFMWLIGLGNSFGKDGKGKKYCEELIKGWDGENKNVTLEQALWMDPGESIAMLPNNSGVILVTMLGDTTFEEISMTLNLCSLKGIPVVGAAVLDY